MFKVGDRVKVKNERQFYNANKEGIVLNVVNDRIKIKLNNTSIHWNYKSHELENLTLLEIFGELGD